MEEFKITKAEALLKQYIIEKSAPHLLPKRKKVVGEDMEKVRLAIAINICETRIKTIDELIDGNMNEN